MQDKLQAMLRSGTAGTHNTRIAACDATGHDFNLVCRHKSLGFLGALPFNQNYSPALTRPQSKDAS